MPQTMQDKDPNEVKDYKIAWGTRLDSGDTISTSTWTVDSGTVTVGTGAQAPSISGTDCIVWLLGGAAGEKAKVRNRITTANGRTHEDSIYVPVADK